MRERFEMRTLNDYHPVLLTDPHSRFTDNEQELEQLW